jgi:hypothetical protein
MRRRHSLAPPHAHCVCVASGPELAKGAGHCHVIVWRHQPSRLAVVDNASYPSHCGTNDWNAGRRCLDEAYRRTLVV